MLPKESGFNQSEKLAVYACANRDVFEAFLSSRRHNLPPNVKLRNNQTERNVYMWMQQKCNIFRQSNFHVSYRRRMSAAINWTRQSIGGACQSSEMAALLNSLSFVIKYLFLPTYRVKHYDYIVKWCSGIQCIWCVSLAIA